MNFILILLITIKIILPIYGHGAFFYETDTVSGNSSTHVSHLQTDSSSPLLRSFLDRNLKVRNQMKTLINNQQKTQTQRFWEQVKDLPDSKVPTRSTTTTPFAPASTSTITSLPKNGLILNAKCENETIVLVDITASVATIGMMRALKKYSQFVFLASCF